MGKSFAGMGTKMQQSHHCGIETSIAERLRSKFEGQQSHHCGIETFKGNDFGGVKCQAAIAPLWD